MNASGTMPRLRLISLRPALSLLTFAVVLSVGRPAVAQSIIKNPGDHLNPVELEPHLTLRLFDTPNNDLGVGAGFRVTIPIVKNGFVSTINNSVGIGFGLDYMRYDACGAYRGYRFDCGKVNHFAVPVVMQWNFFLTPAWSVFGEPGVVFSSYGYSRANCDDAVIGKDRYDLCPNRRTVDPVIFVGARWHFANTTTLTLRAGWPWWSLGISFL